MWVMNFEWDLAKSNACQISRNFDFAYVIAVFVDPTLLVEHDQRSDYGEERFRAGGPELVHDDAVRHVHESHADGWLRCDGCVLLRPAHGVEEREGEGCTDAFETGATIDEPGFVHGMGWIRVWCGGE